MRPPLDECRYLIQLSADAGQRSDSYLGLTPLRAFYQRMTWMLDLFAHLDSSQRQKS